MTEIKLSICVLSYNRPKELKRCIESVIPVTDQVEVIIFDDNSPKIDEIEKQLEFIHQHKNIKLHKNEVNIGYDSNLLNSILKANSNFVLLIGDDDYLEKGAIENLLKCLEINQNVFHCGFLKFTEYNHDGTFKQSRDYKATTKFESVYIERSGSFLFNSILFSGLVFNKGDVINYKEEFNKYTNSIYIQVAIFVFLNKQFGSFFIDGPGIIIGGDGENGFGNNPASSSVDQELKDRSSLLSNINYHKRLFKVIETIDVDLDTNISNNFKKEYRIRLVYMFYQTRLISRKNSLEFLNELNSELLPKLSIFYFSMILILISPRFLISGLIKRIRLVLLSLRFKKIE